MDFASFVLAASTADLAEEPAARPHADAVEFRLDLAEAPLDQLAAYDGALPVLATNRVAGEGGEAADRPERLEALESAVAHGPVEAVDIELSAAGSAAGARLIETAREHDVAVVVSAHDFDGTPPQEELVATLRAADAAGDVGKLAVTATDPGDAIDLLAATWRASNDGIPVATLAMGEPGRHTRAVAPLYGSRIGYAPVDADRATAPGQYDLGTLRRLVDDLKPTA